MNLSGGDGAEIIYSLRNSDKLSSIISDNLSKAGQNVRKYYQRRLPSNPDLDYYYMLRDTPNNETIIVEYGFADSTGDDVSQIKNNWQDLAEAVVKSLASYIGVKYEPPAGANDYIVKSGDTLWSIARNYGLTVQELKDLNNLISNTLSIGQVLKVSAPISSTTYETYTVKSGDTLYGIANKYNLTVTELKDLNNLTSNTLSIGQVLKVSAPTPSPTTNETYTVKSGDTLYGIANKYNLTVTELKALNNLTSDILSIGQVLKVNAPTPSPTTNETYIVKSGDSLYKIANMFNTTVQELQTLNNLTSSLLSIGQTLKIPGTNSTSNVYIVERGDTLYSIARKYNTTVSAIQSLNNLSTSTLSIGQRLLIP